MPLWRYAGLELRSASIRVFHFVELALRMVKFGLQEDFHAVLVGEFGDSHCTSCSSSEPRKQVPPFFGENG